MDYILGYISPGIPPWKVTYMDMSKGEVMVGGSRLGHGAPQQGFLNAHSPHALSIRSSVHTKGMGGGLPNQGCEQPYDEDYASDTITYQTHYDSRN